MSTKRIQITNRPNLITETGKTLLQSHIICLMWLNFHNCDLILLHIQAKVANKVHFTSSHEIFFMAPSQCQSDNGAILPQMVNYHITLPCTPSKLIFVHFY
jgi:hypothetical protein